MNVQINVTFANLYPDVQRHLSVIGKRTANKTGENMFSAVTVSSAEKEIFALYMQQASQNVVAAIEQFVSDYVETATVVSFYVTNTRWNDPNTPSFYPSFSKAFKSYLVNYTLYEYLSMTFPELAKKYFDAAVNFLTAIIRLVFFKAPPVPNGGVNPTTEFLFYIGASNVGTDANPDYAYVVPLTDFTNYNVSKASCTDVGGAEPTFDITKPNLTTKILEDKELPYTFSDEDITAIRAAGTEYVVFYPDTIISANDVLTLTYTMIPPTEDVVSSTAIG